MRIPPLILFVPGGIIMSTRSVRLFALLTSVAGFALLTLSSHASADHSATLDQQLQFALAQNGFTGRIESTLEQRIGHRIDNQLADLGRLLFFDTVGGL